MNKNNEKEVRGRAKHGKRSTRQGRGHKNGKKGTKITKKRYEAGPRTEKEVRGRAKRKKNYEAGQRITDFGEKKRQK